MKPSRHVLVVASAACAAWMPTGSRACWDEAERLYGVSSNLLYAVARAESDLDPSAVNLTHRSRTGLSDFQLLDYYTSSTNNQYLQAHIENNFGGFFFNKVLLLRKALLNEIIGIHYLYTPETGNYAEMSFGVEKIGLLRIALCMRVFSPHNQAYGFRFGLLLNNGN